jgi:hypothetical protein
MKIGGSPSDSMVKAGKPMAYAPREAIKKAVTAGSGGAGH